MNQALITTLPETRGHALCFSYRGVITLDEYRQKVDIPAARLVESYGHYSLLIHFLPDFQGWTPEAAEYNFMRMSERGSKALKLAYIDPPESKMLQVTLSRAIWKADIRFFEPNELQEALQWIMTP